MSKRRKRLERIRQNPNNVRFEDLDVVLIDLGFIRRQSRSGTSHFVYLYGEVQLTVPYKRPFLKSQYIKEALQLIDGILAMRLSEESTEVNDGSEDAE